MNTSGTLNALRVLYNPKLCMPQLTVATFNELPVPLEPKIKAVVLDKDNCFAYPKENRVWRSYLDKWSDLKRSYPGTALLVVSNTSGSNDDRDYEQAQLLEKELGIHVLKHDIKKPGCGEDVMRHFYENKIVESPDQIAVVGDRLLTDVMMANLMGSYSVWVRDGVKISSNPIVKLEKTLYFMLERFCS